MQPVDHNVRLVADTSQGTLIFECIVVADPNESRKQIQAYAEAKFYDAMFGGSGWEFTLVDNCESCDTILSLESLNGGRCLNCGSMIT